MRFSIQRNTLLQVHIVLAAVMLPVVMMYFISGALYPWGVKGSSEKTSYELSLAQPLLYEKQVIRDFVEKTLIEKNITIPSGRSKLKAKRKSFKFEWRSVDLRVVLKSTSDPLKVKMTVKDANWYRQFISLHKMGGGDSFDYYAATLATSLLLLLLSGLILAWQLKKYRPLLTGSLVAGFLIFAVMVKLNI
jgi:hypothetical protein